MTGTPLDLTPFGGLLAALGWLYWALAAALIALALWLPKRRWMKLVAAAVMSCAVVYPLFMRPVQQRADERELARQAYAQKLAAATALFESRCKTAGEFIKKTVQNVDGVVWMKWRDKLDVNDDFDQFKLSDPFGRDCNAEGCIDQLLRLETDTGRFKREVELRKNRYRFVETTDPKDGQLLRYTGVMKLPSSWTEEGIAQHKRNTGREVPDDSYRFTLETTPVDRFTTRYGITWDDISTREDREHWIAGGSLKVIDLQTNEIIAERIGYMMDRGLGDKSGFRNPWAFAEQYACPEFRQIGPSDPRRGRSYNETAIFITKVLKTTRE